MLKDKIYEDFNLNRNVLLDNFSEPIRQLKHKAFESFVKLGFPHIKLENWRHTNLKNIIENDYKHCFSPSDKDVDIEQLFQCELPEMDTYTVIQYNGWFMSRNNDISLMDNGVIIGSLNKAFKEYPEIVEKHFGKYTAVEKRSLEALNTAFAQDGIFIFVPDNVKLEKPIQIINILDADTNLITQPRNLFIIGKNSELTLVHCDHSILHRQSLINSLSEIFIDENGFVDHYKMQNKDAESTLITTINVHVESNARISTNALILNGGVIRNNVNVKLNGKNAQADLKGLYLVDRKQHVDNQVFIHHASSHCYSKQLYKGIIDDDARAVFNGRILVDKDAQKTDAYQTNKNILLTDNASVHSQPQLEIYADDVKCSHGSTVGQLDPNAMFYLRSRGICEHSSRMLLMYAFASEVVDTITIEALKYRLDTMVSKRLKGELSICDQCVLHCSEKAPDFLKMDFKPIV
ncbi:MAG: Fe-S cluster assembly protein SufD [Bacteroidales bacterium]|nr:Fe-S cluster assembly protein SufD [Bacteroidales bacterium]